MKKVVLILISVLIALYAVRITYVYLFPNYHHPSVSMSPTIPADSLVRTSRVKIWKDGIKRFDSVVFRAPAEHTEGKEQIWIFRVYGLPNEKLNIEEGKISVDGDQLILPDDLIYNGVFKETKLYRWVKNIELKEDEYFLLGDNFNNARDSRIIGPIKKNDIVCVMTEVFPQPKQK